MGFARERQIDQFIREVDSLMTLVQAINTSLTALEGRVRTLENAYQVAHRLDRRERKAGPHGGLPA